MKFISILLLSFIFQLCYGQASYIDNSKFKKYSYICRVYETNKSDSSISLFGNGTCFFYKKRNKTYLLSAYHVFSEKSVKIGDKYITNLEIEYQKLKSKEKITQLIKVSLDTIYEFDNFESFDVYAYEITPPKDVLIYYINDYIDAMYFNKIPDKTFSYYYASKKQMENESISDLLESTCNKDYSALSSHFTTYNKIKDYLKDNFLLIPTTCYPGSSGAPIFGEYDIKRGNKKVKVYKFIGLVFGGEDKENCTFGLRVKNIWNTIKLLN